MNTPRFDFSCDEVILPRDSHVTDPDEQHRLSGQTAAIIERLRRGPAARADLAKLAPNITARVSDARSHLRPKGESVEVIERNRKTGYTLYAIVVFPTCVCHRGSVCGDACWKGRCHDGCHAGGGATYRLEAK